MLRRCLRSQPCKLHLYRQPVDTLGSERRPKRPTIDSVVNPIINGVDFAAKFLGINVNLGRDEIVELGVEHSDDLGAFVVHDRLVLLVPKDRNGEPVELF